MSTFLTKSRERIRTKLSKIRSPFTPRSVQEGHTSTLPDLQESVSSCHAIAAGVEGQDDRSRCSSTELILQDLVRDDQSSKDNNSVRHRLSDLCDPGGDLRNDYGSRDCLLMEKSRHEEWTRGTGCVNKNMSSSSSSAGEPTKYTELRETDDRKEKYRPSHGLTPASSLSSLRSKLSKRSLGRRRRLVEDSNSGIAPFHSTPKSTRSVYQHNQCERAYDAVSTRSEYQSKTMHSYHSASVMSTTSGSIYSRDQRKAMAKRIQRMKRRISTETAPTTLAVV